MGNPAPTAASHTLRPEDKPLWAAYPDGSKRPGKDAAVAKFRAALHSKFKMTGGPVSEYYGLYVKVRRSSGIVDVSARGYIERLISKLKRTPRPAYTPLPVDHPLPKMEGECSDLALQRKYRQLVGCLMHPAVTCRPDIAAAVRALSSHLTHPTAVHIRAALRVVDYLHTTRSHTLR